VKALWVGPPLQAAWPVLGLAAEVHLSGTETLGVSQLQPRPSRHDSNSSPRRSQPTVPTPQPQAAAAMGWTLRQRMTGRANPATASCGGPSDLAAGQRSKRQQRRRKRETRPLPGRPHLYTRSPRPRPRTPGRVLGHAAAAAAAAARSVGRRHRSHRQRKTPGPMPAPEHRASHLPAGQPAAGSCWWRYVSCLRGLCGCAWQAVAALHNQFRHPRFPATVGNQANRAKLPEQRALPRRPPQSGAAACAASAGVDQAPERSSRPLLRRSHRRRIAGPQSPREADRHCHGNRSCSG
jgi:hypothetical protein